MTKKRPIRDASGLVRERLYGAVRQKLPGFFATVVSASAAFVSALLRAIKRPYRGSWNSFGALDTYYTLKE